MTVILSHGGGGDVVGFARQLSTLGQYPLRAQVKWE